MTKTNTYAMLVVARKCSISRNKLFELLRAKKIINRDNLPHPQYVECGYLQIATTIYTHPILGELARTSTVATPKGVEWINNLIQQSRYKPDLETTSLRQAG